MTDIDAQLLDLEQQQEEVEFALQRLKDAQLTLNAATQALGRTLAELQRALGFAS
jgi:hypothetical protein